MAVVDAIHALHASLLMDLPCATPFTPDIDWSALLEPSDDSDCPAYVLIKAVGLPDTGDHACNLVLIG